VNGKWSGKWRKGVPRPQVGHAAAAAAAVIINKQRYNRCLPETTPLERACLRRLCRRRHNHRLKTHSANHRAPPTVPMTAPMNHGCRTMPNCSRLTALGPVVTSHRQTESMTRLNSRTCQRHLHQPFLMVD